MKNILLVLEREKVLQHSQGPQNALFKTKLFLRYFPYSLLCKTSKKEKKGATFATIEEESEDEEAQELPTYEEYLQTMGHLQMNVRIVNTKSGLDGDLVSEFGIGCVQVCDTALASTKKKV